MFSQNNSILKQNYLKIPLVLIFSLAIFNCESKKSENSLPQATKDVDKNKVVSQPAEVAGGQTVENEKLEKDKIQDLKKKADLIRFLASIERESLKVAQPSLTATQWEIISFAFDKYVGIKKAYGGFFCHQFEIRTPMTQHFEIYAICEKPARKLADIRFSENAEVIFFSKNWAPVIGEFPSLTAPDRSCFFAYKDMTIEKFNCKNTIYALPPENVEELRLEKFDYDRTANEQVNIEGGIFKDLVKRRDIKMKVPMSGAIEIVEKELKVRDDFEHLLKKPNR